MTSVECVCPDIAHLGECPVWEPLRQRLIWTDIYRGQLRTYDPSRSECAVLWEGDCRVGGFAFTRAGSLVLCTDKGVLLLELDSEGRAAGNPRRIVDLALPGGGRFNDITTDREGRILAGTLDRGTYDGSLYRIEKGAPPVALLRGVRCSNGMAFSVDQELLFHAESVLFRITRYRYDHAAGDVLSPEVFYQGNRDEGLPDGMTMDAEGYLWVAFWGAGCVRRLDPAGRICAEVPIPALQASSVMFGGPALDELYVTSAAEGAADLSTGRDESGAFLGGPLYRFRPGVKGRPEWPAEF